MGTNLIIPHIVGNAGVLRNFSAYLAQLLNVNGQTDLQVGHGLAPLLSTFLWPNAAVHKNKPGHMWHCLTHADK